MTAIDRLTAALERPLPMDSGAVVRTDDLAAALAVVGDRGLFGWGGHLAAMRAVLHLSRGRTGRGCGGR